VITFTSESLLHFSDKVVPLSSQTKACYNGKKDLGALDLCHQDKQQKNVPVLHTQSRTHSSVKTRI
jgi:hypothetical protein